MAEIRVERLHKNFADFVAVRETNLTIKDGEFFALLGPSGCGKTTTLRMIAGLEMPSSGHIYLDGHDVTALRAGKRDIAFVFQLFALYAHMNVRDNIAYPLRSAHMARSEIRERIAEAARILRIESFLDRRISSLTGGDRQRVALARAIVRRPRAFLMDEPIGTLDAEMREAMREELRALHDRIGATTVYVTHDQVEAMSMADRIAVMSEGVVLQAATPHELYSRPATMFVAGFIGSPAMNFLPGDSPVVPGSESLTIGGTQMAIPCSREGVAEGQAVLGIRPEHLYPGHDSGLGAEVKEIDYLGSHQILICDTPAGQVRVRMGTRVPVRIGERLTLNATPEAATVFDSSSGRALASTVHPGGPQLEAAHG